MSNPREQILLDQRFASVIDSMADAELVSLSSALDDELKEGLASLLGFPITTFDDDAALVERLRSRSNRRMSSYNVGIILGDACVQKCIEVLGDASENPTLEDLNGVLPSLIDEFGLGAARLMAVQYSQSLRGFKDLMAADERFTVKITPLSTPVLTVDKAAQDAKRAARRERQKAQKAKRK